jgi:hypothetical protein
MPQPNERQFFSDEDTPIPMHMLFIDKMPRPRYATRSYSSGAARAAQYECFPFYKHISRVVPAESSQEVKR